MVIDTHIWVWWMNRDANLSTAALDLLDAISPRPVVADISLWEVAMLVMKGRITLKTPLREWLETACGAVLVVPVTPGSAACVTTLPATFHGDPADRIIVATALELGLPLMTEDKRIRRSDCVQIMDLPV